MWAYGRWDGLTLSPPMLGVSSLTPQQTGETHGCFSGVGQWDGGGGAP